MAVTLFYPSMFPLAKKTLIRGCQAHIDAGLSCGADYKAWYEPLYAPFKGVISIPYQDGGGGGNWLRLRRVDTNEMIEFAHLNQRIVPSGTVMTGTVIAITGNTGTVTTGPHVHVQILTENNKRIDPEKYNWLDTYMYENKIIRNESTGEYAYVLGGKRRVITTGRAGFAAITALQRKSEIVNVTNEAYSNIPAGQEF